MRRHKVFFEIPDTVMPYIMARVFVYGLWIAETDDKFDFFRVDFLLHIR